MGFQAYVTKEQAYFEEITVVPSGGYPATAQAIFYDPRNSGFDFVSRGFCLLNATSGVEIYFSHDGLNDHGKLGALGTVNAIQIFDFRTERQIWLRTAASGATSGTLEVSAW